MVSEGQVLLEACIKNGTSYTAVGTFDLSPLGGTSVERALAKDIIEIPVPNQDQIGIDIGFASGDQINLETMLGDGWGQTSTYHYLFRVTKYRTCPGYETPGSITDYRLLIGANISYYVTIKNISANLTGGEGDRVACRITFGIVAPS
jgi:hypothetical protein